MSVQDNKMIKKNMHGFKSLEALASTVNVEIFAWYIFLRISRMAVDA